MLTKAYPVAALAMLTVAGGARGRLWLRIRQSRRARRRPPGRPAIRRLHRPRSACARLSTFRDDADPADYDQLEGLEDDEPGALLVEAAADSLPHASDSFNLYFEADATTEAIDHTQVTAAAAAQDPDGRAAVLQTDQSFDEIAESLEAAGFEEEGDVYAGESGDPEPAFPYVADLGDGRIVVAEERAQAEEALSEDGEASEASQLLGELEPPQRQAATIAAEDSCVTTFGIAGEPGGSELQIAFSVDGEADEDRVPSEAEADGRRADPARRARGRR